MKRRQEAYRELKGQDAVECTHPGCGVRFATMSLAGEPKQPDEAELLQHTQSHEEVEPDA